MQAALAKKKAATTTESHDDDAPLIVVEQANAEEQVEPQDEAEEQGEADAEEQDEADGATRGRGATRVRGATRGRRATGGRGATRETGEGRGPISSTGVVSQDQPEVEREHRGLQETCGPEPDPSKCCGVQEVLQSDPNVASVVCLEAQAPIVRHDSATGMGCDLQDERTEREHWKCSPISSTYQTRPGKIGWWRSRYNIRMSRPTPNAKNR